MNVSLNPDNIKQYQNSFYETFLETHGLISWAQLHIFFAAGLCAACDSFMINLMNMLSLIITEKYNISLNDKGVINFLFFIGIVISCSSVGFLTERFCRRQIILCCLISLLIFTVMAQISGSVFQFTVFAFLSGLSLGPLHTLHVNTVSECFGLSMRWYAIINVWTFYNLGDLYLGVLSYFMIDKLDSSCWNFFFISVEILFAAIFIYCCFLLDNSPRYLILKGKDEEAVAVMKRFEKSRINANFSIRGLLGLYDSSYEEDDNLKRDYLVSLFASENITLTKLEVYSISFVDTFKEKIFDEIKNNPKNIENRSYKELLTGDYQRYLVILSSLISIYLAFYLGFKSVFPLILQEAGENNIVKQDSDIFLGLIFNTLAQLPGNPLCAYLGEKKELSRMKLTIFSTSISLVLLFLCFIDFDRMSIYSGFMLLFNLISVNTVYGIISEIFPTSLRDKAMAIINFLGRLSTSLSMMLLIWLYQLNYNFVFLTMAVILILALIITSQFKIDTRNIGLDSI